MSFTSKLKEAESHLSSYEDVAGEILEAAKGGLDKLKSHRDAILASIEAAASTAEKFAKSIITEATDTVTEKEAATPALQGSELVKRLQNDAQPQQFLGRG